MENQGNGQELKRQAGFAPYRRPQLFRRNKSSPYRIRSQPFGLSSRAGRLSASYPGTIMKKLLTALFICGLFCRPASAQVEKAAIDLKELQTPQPHYLPEYTFDSTTEPARWQNESHSLHVSFAPTDRHYFRTEVPDAEQTTTWHAVGWKGER